MQFLEVVLIEILEESARPDGVRGDLEIVDVSFPVRPDVVDGGHGETILSLQR